MSNHFMLPVLSAFLWTVLGAPAGAAQAPTPPPTYREPDKWLGIESTGKSFPYYTTHTQFPLLENSEDRYDNAWREVEAVLIIVHGSGRDASKMIDRAMATPAYQQNTAKIAIFAPLFQFKPDRNAGEGEHYWCKKRWNYAVDSCDDTPVSAFTILDYFYKYIAGRFPNVKHVTLGGHSAGGQLSNRYAAAGEGPNWLKQMLPNVELRFMPMNPSSYLYIETQNPEEWKYGFGDVANRDYVKDIPLDKMIRQLTERKVFYLVGNRDKKTPSTFDTRPAAMKQGPNRRERFRTYLNYATEKTTAGLPWKDNSRFFVVKGSGHQSRKMMADVKAQAIMFKSHADMMATLNNKDWVNDESVVNEVGKTCEDKQLKRIKEDQCHGVSIRMHLEWKGAVDLAQLDTVPRGCWRKGNEVYYAKKTAANKLIGSQATRKLICRGTANPLAASSSDSQDASADDSA